jgi:hypothetical protein
VSRQPGNGGEEDIQRRGRIAMSMKIFELVTFAALLVTIAIALSNLLGG